MNKINALPSKQLFIEMLTRDISLIDAIIDLIDNSIDAARNHSVFNNLNNFSIKINIDNEGIVFEDNCGGLSLDKAIQYAFRFGRIDNSDNDKHNIGRFGIGMKRSIFKICKEFSFISNTEKDSYVITENIENWKEKEQWEFEYKEEDTNLSDFGVKLKLFNLYENVSEEFGSQVFINNLICEIKKILLIPLSQGFKIFVNDNLIDVFDISILIGEELHPFMNYIKIDDVEISIVAGLGKPTPKEAGWYIFCNDRLMVESNKDSLTGWRDAKVDDEQSVVQFHNQYAMFRGIVCFSSSDPINTPMNTTKNGIDDNNKYYKYTKNFMCDALDQITGFLKLIKSKEERDIIISNNRLESIFIQNTGKIFQNPTFPIVNDNFFNSLTFTTITISKEKNLIEDLKDTYNKRTNKELGEFIFSYFLDMEGYNEG